MRAVAVALLGALALAGCQHREDPPHALGPFDGDAALSFAAGLLDGPGNATRYRVPGEPGHAEAAAWLWEQVNVPGWDRLRQDFTFLEYQAHRTPEVEPYRASCPPDDLERLPGATFTNVMATQERTGKPLVVLGAHWDSKQSPSGSVDAAARVPGANDGASGVGLLLQLVREVGTAKLPYDVGIVLFDAEDGFEDCHPLAGSIVYAEAMPQGRPDQFLLLDMVGDPDARFPRESRSNASAGHVVDLLWSRADAHGLDENFVDQQRPVIDDHVPLVAKGVPSVDIIDLGRPGTGFPPYWHTTADGMDKLDAGMLGRVGDLLLDVLDEPGLVPGGQQ